MIVASEPELAASVRREPAAAGIGRGVDAALVDAFETHYDRLVRIAALLVDHRTSAEEVVQEAFARTFERRHTVHGELLPYLRTTVVNLARGRLRARRLRRRHAEDRGATVGPSAETACCARETSEELAAAIAALPRRQREVIVLRFLAECSTKETAAAMGVSEGSVKTHLSRALDALRVNAEVIA